MGLILYEGNSYCMGFFIIQVSLVIGSVLFLVFKSVYILLARLLTLYLKIENC